MNGMIGLENFLFIDNNNLKQIKDSTCLAIRILVQFIHEWFHLYIRKNNFLNCSPLKNT